eukprot:191693-Amphidinium_carterae.1
MYPRVELLQFTRTHASLMSERVQTPTIDATRAEPEPDTLLAESAVGTSQASFTQALLCAFLK